MYHEYMINQLQFYREIIAEILKVKINIITIHLKGSFYYNMEKEYVDYATGKTLRRVSSGAPPFNFFYTSAPDRRVSMSSTDEVERAFLKVDKDGDGVISIEEAYKILQEKLGYNVEKSWQMLKCCDRNGDGALSFSEFIDFYYKTKQQVEELNVLFHQFDLDGDGFITIDEAKEAMRKMALRDEEIEAAFRIHDLNGDGKLDYKEFIRMWNSS